MCLLVIWCPIILLLLLWHRHNGASGHAGMQIDTPQAYQRIAEGKCRNKGTYASYHMSLVLLKY